MVTDVSRAQAFAKYSNTWPERVAKAKYMETVQIALDKKLLEAVDQAARRMNRNRSALARAALREHLRRLESRRREEERDRDGYAKEPNAPDESLLWEAKAAWPECKE